MIRVSLFFIMICGIVYSQNIEIHGKLMAMMHGDLSGHFNLEQLKDKSSIYGLGAVAGLKGEITVINSRPYISRVQQGKVLIDSSLDYNAALFAFSPVQSWKTDIINSEVDLEDLEKILADKADQTTQPLTFLLEGRVQSLKWHVIDWSEGDTVHTYQKHKAAGLNGILKDTPVTIIGFYSIQHQGILTHRRSNLHLHFITRDKSLSGHVDELLFEEGVIRIAE